MNTLTYTLFAIQTELEAGVTVAPICPLQIYTCSVHTAIQMQRTLVHIDAVVRFLGRSRCYGNRTGCHGNGWVLHLLVARGTGAHVRANEILTRELARVGRGATFIHVCEVELKFRESLLNLYLYTF